MKTFAMSSVLGLVIIVGAGCEGSGSFTEADGGATTDAGTEAASSDGGADGGASGLGFTPTNYYDTLNELGAALASADLGDVELKDCGPTVSNDQVNGRLGCDPPGTKYKRLSGAVFKGGAVYVAKNIIIPKDKVLTVTGDGSEHVVLIAKNILDIQGGINVVEGKSGGWDRPSAAKDGVGPGPGIGSSNTTSGSGGGGGHCGKGGNGGAATATGGQPYGNPELTMELTGGSTGGALLPGKGGGRVHLIAGGGIRVGPNGFVDARGGGHVGGGGAGGAILIEAPEVKIEGTVTANGGGGGGTAGVDGKPGSRTSDPAPGGSNGTNLPGGNGGAGTQIDGTNGATNTANAEATGSASGGGGAGRIRINSRGGATVSGLVSPALTTVCATQGPLR